MAIISSIEELKEGVKINTNTPFEAIEPYLKDAQDKYLLPYLGVKLLKKIEQSDTKELTELKSRCRRVLAPFAMQLGSAELSIQYGDSGHTVQRTDTRAPASDAKIEKSDENMLSRAWQNLEYLIQELEGINSLLSDWSESDYWKRRQTMFFDSASDFQDLGLVDIEYRRLTFEKLRHLIISIEKTQIRQLIGSCLFENILDANDDVELEKIRIRLVSAIQAFVANRVAAIHTSQTTRLQRSQSGVLEYKAVIRPLYNDMTDTGNYYTDQVRYWGEQILKLMAEYGEDPGGVNLDFNSEDKKIFVDIG